MERARADRILWRCRRGMKELDLLLERFARERYRSSPPGRQKAFERLLDLPDPLLVELLLRPAALPADIAADAGAASISGAVSADPELASIAALVAGPGRR